MYKKLTLILIGLAVIIVGGTGFGSDSSAGMFIKIGLGLMGLVVIFIASMMVLNKKRKSY